MVTYKQAYEIAVQQMPNIDSCVEYENAFLFQREAKKHSIGGHGFCVVLKDSGKIVSKSEYLEQYDHVEVRTYDVESETKA